MFRTVRKLVVASLAITLLPSVAPAQTTEVFTQAPCPYTSGLCLDVFPDSGPSVLVRSFAYTAPGAGKAIVTFHGSMQCMNSSTVDDETRGVVDLQSQITNTSGAVADYTAPGGSRISMRLPPWPFFDGTAQKSAAVNLHSTRVIALASGGIKRVYFKFSILRMDVSTRCIVLSAAFTVHYVP